MATRKRTGTKLLKSGRNIVKKSTLRAKRFFNKKGKTKERAKEFNMVAD